MVSQAAPTSPSISPGWTTLNQRFMAFVLEQFPFAHEHVARLWSELVSDSPQINQDPTPKAVEELSASFCAGLQIALQRDLSAWPAPLPAHSAAERYRTEVERLVDAVDGHFSRESIRLTFTPDEKRWMLQGIVLTRAVDNRMKQMFLSGELKYGDLGFQGKGFRSLGQEAIYAAALRLRRGDAFVQGHQWCGDVVAPLIRDLGIALAFTDDVGLALNAQAGKAGAPMNGKDLHLGDYTRGVLPAAAPLSIATCSVTGVALAMRLREEDRVALSFIGEGGSSLGEWHEAINLAAVRRLPMIFCLQNNQTALSTRVDEQSAVRVFGEKAAGYGMPHVTIDGTNPEEIAATFTWAAERARKGLGPVLIEVLAMRMCGHAHHDDMLYLGGDPPLGFELQAPGSNGYVDTERFAFWADKDPLQTYAAQLEAEGLVEKDELADMQQRAKSRCDEAMEEIKTRPWPDGENAGRGVYAEDVLLTHPPCVGVPPLDVAHPGDGPLSTTVQVESAPDFSPKGNTYLDGVCRGIGDALRAVKESFLLGEDVGAPYGNAFLLLKPLLEEHHQRIWNAPIAEGAIIGALVGAALEGMRPIGEMQFNDFVASGFNELVNNAAKLRYRTGLQAPFVLRMPYGGLRRAGPYHSQDTSPWFFRSFGLKIVAPSTPHDARALMMSAVLDDDPVLYYEHIGLYRDPKIKQLLSDDAPDPIPLGKAAFRKLGEDISLISYGAYVHRAMRVAEELEREEGAGVEVLDLRSLCPLDWGAIERSVRRTGKVLLVGEDSRTGSILESIASKISESLYEHLDGPVRILGALDAPVPYAPSLEDAYLVSHDHLKDSVRALLEW